MNCPQCTSAPHREPDLALNGTHRALPLEEDLEVMVLVVVEVQEVSTEVPAETEIDSLDLLFQTTLLDNLLAPVPGLYLTGHPKLDQDPLILVSF